MKIFVHDKEEWLIGRLFKKNSFFLKKIHDKYWLWFSKSKRKVNSLFWPFGYEN